MGGWSDAWNGALGTVSDTFFSTVETAGEVVSKVPSLVQSIKAIGGDTSNAAAGRPLELTPIYSSGLIDTQANRDLNRGTTGTSALFSTTAGGGPQLSGTELALLFGAAVLGAIAIAKL